MALVAAAAAGGRLAPFSWDGSQLFDLVEFSWAIHFSTGPLTCYNFSFVL
jgi:hypothetical protein